MAIKLDPNGSNYILTRRDDKGSGSAITLSPLEVLTLAQSAQALQLDILRRHDPRGENYLAVVATDVAQIELNPESLGQAILMTLIAPTGSRLTFAVPEQIVALLVERLPTYLAGMRAKKMTRQ
jgi:hypothetical protein